MYFTVESKLFRPRRPRSSSDALSASYNGDLRDGCNRCNSYDNLPHDQDSDGDEGLIHVPAMLSSRSHDDEDLSPPDIGVASLDFDPMSFQCSPPKLDNEGLDSNNLFHIDTTPGSGKERFYMGAQTPASGNSSEPMSPFQERLISPFITPDRSPSAEKIPKAPSFAEKMVLALSPKVGRKAVRSPPLTISDPVTVTLPSRVSEMIGSMQFAGGGSQSPLWYKESIIRDPGTLQAAASRSADFGFGQLSIGTPESPGTMDSTIISQWNNGGAQREAGNISPDTSHFLCSMERIYTNNGNQEFNVGNKAGLSLREEIELSGYEPRMSVPAVPTPPGM